MEKILQYIWQMRIWGNPNKTLTDGRKVKIIDGGRLNNDSGPDFSNAHIIIDDIEWIGNVEIHVKASDWYRHGHNNDKAYDNVILHVVGVDDTKVESSNGMEIAQLQLPITQDFINLYTNFSSKNTIIRCASHLDKLSELTKTDWLESLAFERMQTKAARISDILKNNNSDWQQTCFSTIARSLGFGLNSEPFEMLALRIPLLTLSRHSDNLLQLQALLFGCAGFLDRNEHPDCDYHQLLCREFYFLCKKYELNPLPRHIWKFARTRPANFPHRRLALLAKFVENGFSLLHDIIEAEGNIDKLTAIFNCELDAYWTSHYAFDVPCQKHFDTLSRQSIDLILINAVAPLYYSYGEHSGNIALEEIAFKLQSELKAESNSIISGWSALGLKADNAMRSQALLQLRKCYCDAHKCLNCRFGNSLLHSLNKKKDTLD